MKTNATVVITSVDEDGNQQEIGVIDHVMWDEFINSLNFCIMKLTKMEDGIALHLPFTVDTNSLAQADRPDMWSGWVRTTIASRLMGKRAFMIFRELEKMKKSELILPNDNSNS